MVKPIAPRAQTHAGRLTLVLLAAGLAFAIAPEGAALAGPAALSPADQGLVDQALSYLQSLHAAEGRFSQTDPKGQVSDGQFWFERPGRARFAYDGDKGLLVVSDGDTVSVVNRRLKTEDQYPLEQTPLKLLLADPLRLGRDVAVTGLERRPGGFTLALGSARSGVQGRLLLEFSEAPIGLRGWTVIDAQKARTQVRILSLTRRSSLPPALFVVGDTGTAAAPH